MAIGVISAVLKLTSAAVTSSERLVLLDLAYHAHHDGGSAWPAVRTIAAETSLSRRAVQKILPRLLHKGFIAIEGRMSRGAIRYALDLQALDRERRSQTATTETGVHCEPCSRTTDGDCEPGSLGGEPGSPGGANHVRGGGEPGSPDLSFNRNSEPSQKKNYSADAPANSVSDPLSEEPATASPISAVENTTDEEGEREREYELLYDIALAICREYPDMEFHARQRLIEVAVRKAGVSCDQLGRAHFNASARLRLPTHADQAATRQAMADTLRRPHQIRRKAS
jgi:hypothetical protein